MQLPYMLVMYISYKVAVELCSAATPAAIFLGPDIQPYTGKAGEMLSCFKAHH